MRRVVPTDKWITFAWWPFYRIVARPHERLRVQTSDVASRSVGQRSYPSSERVTSFLYNADRFEKGVKGGPAMKAMGHNNEARPR